MYVTSLLLANVDRLATWEQAQPRMALEIAQVAASLETATRDAPEGTTLGTCGTVTHTDGHLDDICGGNVRFTSRSSPNAVCDRCGRDLPVAQWRNELIGGSETVTTEELCRQARLMGKYLTPQGVRTLVHRGALPQPVKDDQGKSRHDLYAALWVLSTRT